MRRVGERGGLWVVRCPTGVVNPKSPEMQPQILRLSLPNNTRQTSLRVTDRFLSLSFRSHQMVALTAVLLLAGCGARPNLFHAPLCYHKDD
jgi:hypothetical protein